MKSDREYENDQEQSVAFAGICFILMIILVVVAVVYAVVGRII